MSSLDELFDLLSKERRRYVLYYLDQQESPVSVDELLEQVAGWEADPPASSLPEEKYAQLEIELLHNDLPKASETEYVQYDRDEEKVELVGPPPEFDAIISLAKVIERPDRKP